MSEFKRYDMCGFGGGLVERPEGAWYHMDDFDRVTAELQFNQSELLSSRMREKELQQRLTAADERSDVLEGLLREWLIDFVRTHSGLQRLKERTRAELRQIDAALNPAEGGVDEAI